MKDSQALTPEGHALDAPEICAIGLDVGGTKIAGGSVERSSGRVLSKRIVPTFAGRGEERVLSSALEMARELLIEANESGRRVLGIGVGVAELVDPEGNVTSGNVIAWCGMPVQERFSRLAPALVEADVRAAALAEAVFGAGRAYSLFLYLTVGTGISSCLVQNGRPYTGARGGALVAGTFPVLHSTLHDEAASCATLEGFASGPALVRRYNERRSACFERAEEVLSVARDGDRAAIEVVRTAGEALGAGVGFLVNVLDPEAVIVGGGLGIAGGSYWNNFVASARKHVWSDAARRVPILPAGLGADAGFVGAAAAVFRKQQADTPSRSVFNNEFETTREGNDDALP